MVLRRRIRADVTQPKVHHSEPRGASNGTDLPFRVRLFRLFEDPVEVDRAAAPDGREGVGEEPQRGMREVQNGPIDRADLPEHRAGVSLADLHALRPVRRDVRPEQPDRDRIRVRCMDLPRPSSFRDQDSVRSDARKRVGDDFLFAHEVRDPLPLGGQPRAEVRRREVDVIAQPVLHVDRRGPSLSGDDPDLADASLSLDPAVLRRDPDFRVPLEDGTPHRLPMRPKTVRDFDDRDIADDVERTRQGSSEGGRHVGDVLVASDRHEFLGELPLVDREAEVHAPRRGQQEQIAFPHDAQMLHEDAALQEPLPDRFALPLRHRDAPGPHGVAMPRPAVKRFRASRERS